ncbi:MAG: Sensor protein [Myxococcaceae bacterium]|nr:Sensor protein [Myxococcaceae bacterium]
MNRHRVWIVEDSPLEAALAMRVLTPEVDVVLFPDGASAIEALSTATELPDVIMADWVLPGIDGLELCRLVRQTYDEIALPVMIVTAREGRDVRLEALEARVNDIVQKPFDPEELRARIRVLARTRRTHQRSTELESALELFVGTVSHDLRTPLHAMSGYASLMLTRDDLPEKHRHWADRIVTVGARMARMLDELVELSEARGGTGIQLDRRTTRLDDVVAMVLDEVRAANPTALIECTCDGENSGLWDADRVARVVQNLVANAVVHGTPGTVIRVAVREEGNDAVLVVHNEGKPIPEALRQTLFDPFRRARQSGSGLGLGLYITRELVKAHGGEVSFTSTAEAGTAFTVRLPLGIAAASGSSARRLA